MPVSADKDSLPIREVSKITGVNSVTLRAWERRYGLVRPLRTAKGHRLYRPEDIERIQEIQSWLTRGLAISKVKEVLDSPEQQSRERGADGLWQEFAQPLANALERLNRPGLDQLLGQLTSLYPTELVVDQLLEPLLTGLRREHYYGAATKLALLETALREYFCSALFRQRQKARGPRILVTQLPGTQPDLLAMIFSYSLSVKDYRVDYLSNLPEAELVFALQQMQSRALVIYADSASGNLNLLSQRGQWESILQVPIFVAGKLSPLNNQAQEDGGKGVLGASHTEMLANFIEREPQSRPSSSTGGSKS